MSVSNNPLSRALVRVCVLSACGALAFVSGCAKTATEASGPAVSASTADAASPSREAPANSSSVRAYIDPATGQLRDPTAEELAAEAEAAKKQAVTTGSAKPSEPREVVLPNGAVMIELDESAQHPLVACVQKDGAIKMDHECEQPKGRK